MRQNWRDISYLQHGSARQRSAYIALRELLLLEELKTFDPILVGTIPIGVDVPQSHLDVICYTTNLRKFETTISQKFGLREGFLTKRTDVRGRESIIARFTYNQFKFEVCAQDQPTEQQDAYKHMVTEYRILQLSNEHTRLKIKRLRSQGQKTEAAFAQILGLSGDAYEAMLSLGDEDDDVLKTRLAKAGLI